MTILSFQTGVSDPVPYGDQNLSNKRIVRDLYTILVKFLRSSFSKGSELIYPSNLTSSSPASNQLRVSFVANLVSDEYSESSLNSSTRIKAGFVTFYILYVVLYVYVTYNYTG